MKLLITAVFTLLALTACTTLKEKEKQAIRDCITVKMQIRIYSRELCVDGNWMQNEYCMTEELLNCVDAPIKGL